VVLPAALCPDEPPGNPHADDQLCLALRSYVPHVPAGGVVGRGGWLTRLALVQAKGDRVLTLLSEMFLPFSFISVGMRVSAATLEDRQAWSLCAVLLLLALASKALCGFGVTANDRRFGVDRWLVVFGLILRGLPGLVFATTSLSAGVINASQYSALGLMITATTVLALALLERHLLAFGSLWSLPSSQ
jgi:hypothetical protein